MRTSRHSIIVKAGLIIILTLCGFQVAPAKSGSENPALQPYQAEEDVGDISPNGYYKTASFDVPAGKRLVVELVTIKAIVDSGVIISEATISVPKLGAGPRLNFHLTPAAIGTGPGCASCVTFVVTQPLQLYCDAGTGALQIRTERTATSGLYSTRFSVSGHLVDLP